MPGVGVWEAWPRSTLLGGSRERGRAASIIPNSLTRSARDEGPHIPKREGSRTYPSQAPVRMRMASDRAALDVTGHRRIPQCQLKGIEPGVLQVTQTSHILGCLHAKREIHDLAESLATGGCVAEEAPPNQPD